MSTFQSKYKVLQKIGEGSFSEVLKCEDVDSGLCYAAKRLKKVYKSESRVTACAEIIAAEKVPHHAHLLNMLAYHYDSFTGRVTFLFELMDMSMHDYLKTKAKGLSEHRGRNYLFQMLNGLSHLHHHGLFHRDVKPENILIKFPSILYAPLSQTYPYEVIKLADLGSVRGIFSEPPYTEYISTRWYRSPECLLTVGNYGPKMDIWAAGCVFYEMLTLKPLFPGSNEIDQLAKIHQIIGSPTIQYLSKLKSRSRNCIYFPKTKGTGLDIMLPFMTRDGRNILRLMLEYDSEKRVNIKRLLRNCYFDDISTKKLRTHFDRQLDFLQKSTGPRLVTENLTLGNVHEDGSDTHGHIFPHKPTKLQNGLHGSISSAYPTVKPKKFERRSVTRGSKEKLKKEKGEKCDKTKPVKANTMPCLDIPFYGSGPNETLPLVNYKVQHVLNLQENVNPKIRSLKSCLRKDNVRSFSKPKTNNETGKKHGDRSFFQTKSCIISKRTEVHNLKSRAQT